MTLEKKTTLDIGSAMLALQLKRKEAKPTAPVKPKQRGVPGKGFIASWFRGKQMIKKY